MILRNIKLNDSLVILYKIKIHKMNRFFIIGLLLIATANAQDYFPTNSGVKSKELNYQAFTNATVYLTPTNIIKNATLLELNVTVIAVGTNV